MKISIYESKKEKDFKLIYEEYFAPFCLYARRFIEDSIICEDIVSEVFASIWDKQDTVEIKKETVVAYLKTCVRNNCLNYLRHQEYEWTYNEVCQNQEPTYAATPDSVYTLNELYEMLHKALDKLPENYRIVFIKSFYEGKTHAEIAQELNLSIKSINRYKQKVMEYLRNDLKEYLPLILCLLTITKKF